MRQLAFLVAAYVLTLALLLAVWMVAFAKPAPTPTPPPTPTAVPTLAAAATATPAPQVTASPTQTPTPMPSPTATATRTLAPPIRTLPPSIPPPPSLAPGETLVVTVNGADFIESEVPEGARLTRVGTSAVFDTTESIGEPIWTTWRLPEELIPTGAVIVNVDVAVCGHGEGDFWEIYGPAGGEPEEVEVEPPDSDGCWHFEGAPGSDLSVLGSVQGESTMTVEYLEYRVTFGQ